MHPCAVPLSPTTGSHTMTCKDSLRALQEILATGIPLAKHLGVTVEAYDGACLTLTAPIAGNSNYHDTAFAGSLNAVTTLAGWGLLWLVLTETDLAARIVIQESIISYRKPVTRNFSARCYKPTPRRIAQLFSALKRKGKARLELAAEICEGEELAVLFKGQYVVQLNTA